MFRSSHRFSSMMMFVLLTGGVAWLGLSTDASAEIETRAPTGVRVTPEAQDLRAECWQGGTKVFEGNGYTGVDLATVASEKSLRLSRPGQQRNALIVVPLDEAVCFIERED